MAQGVNDSRSISERILFGMWPWMVVAWVAWIIAIGWLLVALLR